MWNSVLTEYIMCYCCYLSLVLLSLIESVELTLSLFQMTLAHRSSHLSFRTSSIDLHGSFLWTEFHSAYLESMCLSFWWLYVLSRDHFNKTSAWQNVTSWACYHEEVSDLLLWVFVWLNFWSNHSTLSLSFLDVACKL